MKRSKRSIQYTTKSWTRIWKWFIVTSAGIDVGNESHYVAVRPEDDSEGEPVRRFACFTADLQKLAAWLHNCGVQTVAMQSTGVYWIPLFDILEAAGFEVYLVNPRQTHAICRGVKAMYRNVNGS